jgi:hypothetical protein
VIVASHAGEELLPSLLAGGASAAPVLLLVLRARLGRLARTIRRLGPG